MYILCSKIFKKANIYNTEQVATSTNLVSQARLFFLRLKLEMVVISGWRNIMEKDSGQMQWFPLVLQSHKYEDKWFISKS